MWGLRVAQSYLAHTTIPPFLLQPAFNFSSISQSLGGEKTHITIADIVCILYHGSFITLNEQIYAHALIQDPFDRVKLFHPQVRHF